ncbi:hypothetical protein FA13DRAFT_1784217 [Coprinellus micaceus]|uniref:Uncharacterized protein n=1 Tax=Coprinellus micaceus TaxID=71717 RepID=A0A4Y7TZN7_COPMI|nr:hypothetical protein FA13DRAFT_1784217 [Coprinellus micaceus]
MPPSIHDSFRSSISTSLEAVELLFSWDSRNRSHPCLASEQLIVHEHGWDHLDALFTSRALFSCLRAVRITAQLEDEPERSRYEEYRSTDKSELGWTLREQMQAALPEAAKDAGLLVDVGERKTQRAFHWITKPILDEAWEHRPTK